jgi:hypothetical protein
MVNCYPKEYLNEYDVLEERYYESKDPDAKKKRDRRARELRRQGWTVQIETFHNYDLGIGASYSLFAERKKQKKTELVTMKEIDEGCTQEDVDLAINNKDE